MSKPCAHLLAKGADQGLVTLVEHTEHVLAAAEKIAVYRDLDDQSRAVVRWGAILHDMGKANPIFQRRLSRKKEIIEDPYRHELGSLFFVPLVPSHLRTAVIDMIVAHHRSPEKDGRLQGIVDLYEAHEDEPLGRVFDMHFQGWEQWSQDVYLILNYFGIETREISREEAFEVFYDTVEHCRRKPSGCSFWKGHLIAADHLASSVNDKIYDILNRSFANPDLTWYFNEDRKHALYPLSMINTVDNRPHTLVTAPTGAGKTDFLLRRTRGRVFYLLPFQASINAMYERFKTTVPGEDAVRLLHAASHLILANPKKGNWTERAVQDKVGAPLKVLTPHQVASIVFGTRGYEATLLDMQGCDVILDEIHTYAEVLQAIVLRIIEVLKHHGCRIHIGTATMPSHLKRKVLSILGKNETYEVSLLDEQLASFDRHIIHKIPNLESAFPVLRAALERGDKVLVVLNQVRRAQEIFTNLATVFPDIDSMLIHSRFMRGDRAKLERRLKQEFDDVSGPCLVVSTQVVEVSLDISFDLMITEAAPLDSLIQRFGRINRRRNDESQGKLKPVYVLAPDADPKSSLPYEYDLVTRSYDALPDGHALREREVQTLIDSVFPDLQETSIDLMSKFKNGKFLLKELAHCPKSALLEALEIESACCIRESDKFDYAKFNSAARTNLEIPVPFKSIAFRGLEQVKRCGTNPFIVPDVAYDDVLGMQLDKASSENYSTCVIL